MLFVYASANAGTNRATTAGSAVDDLAAVHATSPETGAYDLPGLTTTDGVATFGENKVAYFKDTESNILSLGQAE